MELTITLQPKQGKITNNNDRYNLVVMAKKDHDRMNIALNIHKHRIKGRDA